MYIDMIISIFEFFFKSVPSLSPYCSFRQIFDTVGLEFIFVWQNRKLKPGKTNLYKVTY